jgi:aspartate kinase
MLTVQKFGGTSVADPDAIRRLIDIVRTARGEKGPGPIVVVSAMSGVTDGLLAAAAAASAAHADEALAKLRQLREKHIDAIQALCTGSRAQAAADYVNARFDELDSVLTGVSILREVGGRTLDAVAASGELLSSRIIAAAIEEAGLPASWLDARRLIVTDDDHTRAMPLLRETNAALRATILPVLEDGHVPVLGGFIGSTREGVTTTLGRGGSDYSGALVGAAVGASEIQIWTDVDGMLTADPRVVTGTRLVPRLSFGEASELAYFGAKVLHPSTIHPAVEHEIPVRIVNSRRPEGEGTLITASRDNRGGPFAALACKKGITVVDITSDRMLMAYGFLRRVFEVFERFRTSVDVVTTSEVSVSVTVDDRRQLDAVTEALGEFAEVSSEFDCALLCAVGDNLRMEPTTMARLLRALEDVPLRMVSQAASRRNITVVLREADLNTAMQRLHTEFFA